MELLKKHVIKKIPSIILLLRLLLLYYYHHHHHYIKPASSPNPSSLRRRGTGDSKGLHR